MEQAKEAIVKGYQDQVKASYKAFAESVALAAGDEADIAAAKSRFSASLDLAKQAKDMALELAAE